MTERVVVVYEGGVGGFDGKRTMIVQEEGSPGIERGRDRGVEGSEEVGDCGLSCWVEVGEGGFFGEMSGEQGVDGGYEFGKGRFGGVESDDGFDEVEICEEERLG